MKKIITGILKAVAIFFITLTTTILGILIFIGIFAAMASDEYIEVEKDSYLYIDTDIVVKEEKTTDLVFSSFNEDVVLIDILLSINAAIKDERIKGIVLDADNIHLTMSQIEEVGYALNKFKKSGKQVIATCSAIGTNKYLLASYANKIVMEEAAGANITITGYYNVYPYLTNLLSFVGLEYDVLHVGDYKSYGENYSKEAMSDEYKEDLKKIFNSLHKFKVNTIAENRNIDASLIEKNIEEGTLVFLSAIKAKEHNLIDIIDSVDDYTNDLKVVQLVDYMKTYNVLAYENIGIITLEGNIVDTKTTLEDAINLGKIKNEFNKLVNDKTIKNIVVRINSGGGSALESSKIYNYIKNHKQNKHIYISMGDYAASGGYFIAAAGDNIYSLKSTITGSIGVVSLIPKIEKVIDKLGINLEVVSKGRNSGIENIFISLTDEEKLILQRSMQEIYNEFKRVVVGSRNIQNIDEVANGRIYTGEQGVGANLVDGNKTLLELLDYISEKDGIDYGYYVVEYEVDSFEFLSNMFSLVKTDFSKMTNEISNQYSNKAMFIMENKIH